MILFMAGNLICIESKFEWTFHNYVKMHKEPTVITEGLHHYVETSLPDLLSKL